MISGPLSSLAERHCARRAGPWNTREELSQNPAEQFCWEVARRNAMRIVGPLYRKQLLDGVHRLDEVALLDKFFHASGRGSQANLINIQRLVLRSRDQFEHLVQNGITTGNGSNPPASGMSLQKSPSSHRQDPMSSPMKGTLLGMN